MHIPQQPFQKAPVPLKPHSHQEHQRIPPQNSQRLPPQLPPRHSFHSRNLFPPHQPSSKSTPTTTANITNLPLPPLPPSSKTPVPPKPTAPPPPLPPPPPFSALLPLPLPAIHAPTLLGRITTDRARPLTDSIPGTILLPPYKSFDPSDVVPGINNRMIETGDLGKDLWVRECDTEGVERRRGKGFLGGVLAADGEVGGVGGDGAVEMAEEGKGKGERIRLEIKDVKVYSIVRDVDRVYALLMRNERYRAQFEALVRRNKACRVWFVTGCMVGRVMRRGLVDEGGEVIWDEVMEMEEEDGGEVDEEKRKEKEDKKFPEVVFSVEYKEVELCPV